VIPRPRRPEIRQPLGSNCAPLGNPRFLTLLAAHNGRTGPGTGEAAPSPILVSLLRLPVVVELRAAREEYFISSPSSLSFVRPLLLLPLSSFLRLRISSVL